jgi:hypothetical protein
MNRLKQWQKVKNEYVRIVRVNDAEQAVIDAEDWEIACELRDVWSELFSGTKTIKGWQIEEVREALV